MAHNISDVEMRLFQCQKKKKDDIVKDNEGSM